MYEAFYNLKAEPFRLSPDHKFCYEHKGYAKARAYMAYAFKRAEGFVMITGRPGTGKTTLIGELVENLASDKVRTANLVCTQLQADDLLKTVAFSFGISQGEYDKAQLLQRLTTLFQRWHQEGGRALLIVDEAQDLSVSAMEELRLLTNIQIGGQPLVQIFLLGQPELRDLVMSPEMEQVHQRVIAASHLRGLEVDETEAYVAHRLLAVGWQGDPAIDRAIFPLIHKFSEGVPRRINLICSRLFLLGSVEQRHQIEVADVRDVIGELQAENLAAGSWFSEADFDLTREPEWLEVPGQSAVAEPEAEPAVEPENEEQAAVPVDQGQPVDDEESAEDDVKKNVEASVATPPPASESEPVEPDTESPAVEVVAEQVAEPEPEPAPEAVQEHEGTVDVVEELFEVVTSPDSVDYVEALDDVDGDLTEGEQGEGRRYFSGRVITESGLGSEAAISELSSLPDNFVADAQGNPLTEFDPEEDAPPAKQFDELQRDGKAWPTASRPNGAASKPAGRTSRALGALALVALVGAGLFFLELYLTRENGGAPLTPASKVVAPQNIEPSPAAERPASAALDRLPEPLTRSDEDANDGDDPAAIAVESSGTLDEETVFDPEGVEAQAGPVEDDPVLLPADAQSSGSEAGGAADTGAETQPVLKQVYVVNFDFDSAALGRDANAVLGRALEKLQRYPGSTATIARTTQGQTPGASAATLSSARAGAVEQYFLAEGVSPSRINIESVSRQELALSVSGQDYSRTVQVIVSRTLES